MMDSMELTTTAQLQALAHPLRQRLLRLLADEALTNRQLAKRLGVEPGRLHFHVRTLERAGLIAVVAERPKGGVVEKYYRPVASRFVTALPFTDAGASPSDVVVAMLAAALQEYRGAAAAFGGSPPGVIAGHEQARLSAAQQERIRRHLDAIRDELRLATTAPADEGSQVSPLMVVTWLMHRLPSSPTEE